jgi:hypothetical protein
MKSKPKSIRFDEEKLDFAKKHLKKDSAQKVVDYLLDSVWWRNQAIELPENIRSNPITVAEAFAEPQQIVKEIETKKVENQPKTRLPQSKETNKPLDTEETSSYLDSLTPLQRKKLGL